MTFGRMRLGLGWGSGGHGNAIIPGIISAGAGSYSWSGDDMTPISTRTLAAGGGSYTWSGTDATLLFGRVISAGGGSYVWTGQDATLTKASPPSFTGLADASIYDTNVAAFWGLRAAKASYATGSNPAIDIVDQAGANSLTVNINSSGDLDDAAITTWIAAHSVTEIHVSKLYDQIGTNHMTQGTDANRPKLVQNVTSTGKSAIVSRGNTSALVAGGSAGLSQAFTTSMVYKRASSSTFRFVLGTTSSGNGTVFTDSANNAVLFAGSVSADFTKTDAAFGSVQAMFNGGASKARFGGTTTSSLSPGAGALGTPAIFDSNWPPGTDISVCEVAAISGDQSASFAAANTNQDNYWGT